MPDFERRSLELTAEQWAAIEAMAADMGSIAPTGPRAGEPSWRTLIKNIADGTLSVGRQCNRNHAVDNNERKNPE